MCCKSGSKPPNAGCQFVTSICVAFVRVPTTATAPETGLAVELVGQAPPSPAGPIDTAELAGLAPPSSIPLPLLAQTLRFSQRQIEFVFRARREFGEVFRMRGAIPGGPVITSHPDHVRSLFGASRSWLDRKPGTYEWIPFGGGIRRCLGVALAMAEQRVVLETMARRLDLEADRPEPERALHRNVTMIPSRGGRVVLRGRRA
jgi:cytochrome P450